MASSLADHHHMIKRENNIVVDHNNHHSVHHIHDEEDMEEDETSNPFEEVSTSPVFGHNLRSSSRNLYSIPSISITMSSHHPVKRDVNLSASACLDDLVHGTSHKRNGIESNGSNPHSVDNGNHHQNNSTSVRHRNLSCLNGRSRHRSSPSTALERYCESPSTFLLDPRLDSRHNVSDFPCGNSDDDEGSNHTLNGGRSNSRLSEGTEEILFHSSVLGDTSQHSSMLRDVSVVTPTIETVVSTLIPGRDVVVHGSGVNGGVVGSDVVIQTSGRVVSSSEVIVSSDDCVTDEEMAEIVSGEDVIVTTTAPSVTMTVLRTCSSSPTTSSSCIERRIVEPSSTGSILRNQLLQGSSAVVSTSGASTQQQQLVDDGDDLCILKEPPLNHYNSNQSFVSSDTSPLSSVPTNASIVICTAGGHKSIVASPAMVSLPGLVTSSHHHQAALQMTAPSNLPVTVSSSINPPTLSSLQQQQSAAQQQLSKSDNVVTVSTSGICQQSNGGQQSQPLDIKILPAGLIQLASNLAAVFPSSAIQSKQIAIQLLREDGTSIILPITTVTSRCQSGTGQSTLSLSTAPMVTSPSLIKSSNVATMSPSNVSSSAELVTTTIVPQTKLSDSKSTGMKNGNNNKSKGMKIVTSSLPSVKSTNSVVGNGTQVMIGQPQSLLATVMGQQSSASTVQSSTSESERPFKCELCSSTFTRLGNYTRHKKIHSLPTKEDQRFKCEICSKSFIQRCDLARHLHIHRGTEPHRCPQCGKGYIRHSDLVTHQRFHNKEKPFTCPHCSKGFCQRGDLNRHLRSIHLQMKPLLCSHCHKKFAKEETLLRHINAVHRDKILDGRG